MCQAPGGQPTGEGTDARASLSSSDGMIEEKRQKPLKVSPCTAQKSRAPPPPACAEEVPEDLAKGLQRTPKYLPCRFLYDDHGSQLYEQITGLPEYYPYRTEKALLTQHAAAIAARLPRGAVVVELGCGDCTKTSILLKALLQRERSEAGVHSSSADARECHSSKHGIGHAHGASVGSSDRLVFCGVDCSGEMLRQTQRALARLLPELPDQQVELYEAEYLAGVAAVRRRHPDAPLAILWLGSSVGNFSAPEAAAFLGKLRAAAGPRAQLLLCTDRWKDTRVLRAAYNDSQGVSEAFIINGMHHALRTLGHPDAYRQDLFQYEVEVHPIHKQVEMYVRASRRVTDVLPGVDIEAGERVLVEISRKFTPEAVASMAYAAGFCPDATWGNALYSMQLLLAPEEALAACWADTDSLFAAIEDWGAQPIGLRHPFCFYYGHVASFTKSRVLPQEEATEMDVTMSRGIDPVVTDPSRCHAHPEVPPAWPTKSQLEEYAAGVRRQVLAAVAQGVVADEVDGEALKSGKGVGMHGLLMALEHERMHQETLCYMLAQQRKAEAAAGQLKRAPWPAPPANSAERGSKAGSVETTPFYLQQCSYLSAAVGADSCSSVTPTGSIADLLGLLEPGTPAQTAEGPAARTAALSVRPPSPDTPTSEFVRVPAGKVSIGIDPSEPRGFLWDCEVGALGPLSVPSVRVARTPVTVAQFRRFVFEERGYERPELWEPSAFEHFHTSGHSMPATWSLLPAATGSADTAGAASDAPAGHQLWVHMPEGSYPAEQVADCPACVSQAEAEAYCRAHDARLMSEDEWQLAAAHGGIQQLASGGWEWTSTVLEPLPCWRPDPQYPEYSADFYDGQHAVLRGAGTYTHPSLARASFRNFYQPLYPYVLAKFRLVRDAEEE